MVGSTSVRESAPWQLDLSTPESFSACAVEAFRRADLIPERGFFRKFDDQGKFCGCCLLTALYVLDYGGVFDVTNPLSAMPSTTVRCWAVQHMHEQTVNGIVAGWDGQPLDPVYARACPEYATGFTLGQAAARAVFSEFANESASAAVCV